MQLKKTLTPELPIWLAAAILAAGSLLLIVQLILGAVVHGKQMKLSAALTGMQQLQLEVPLSPDTLLSGKYQAALAGNIGTREPYYPTAVRLRNQLEYSLFGVSQIPSIIVGNNGQLLETGYVTDYCTRDLAAFLPAAPEWAGKIRQMQDKMQAQGKIFLYIITPSKVAQYPDELPAGMPCFSKPQDRTGLVPAWAAIVQQAGVHLVNTTTLLSAAHAQYPFRLYPSGGTHWNQVGTAIATQAIEAELAAQRQDGSFRPFTFIWTMSSHPDSTDNDLASLMNLFWLPAGPKVPQVTYRVQNAAPDCRPLRIVIIGGSFMESIGASLSRLNCGAQVVEYFYWKIGRNSWDKSGVKSMTPVIPALRDQELQQADVILYEENEALLGHSNHGAAFYQWLQRSAQGGGR